MAIFKFKIKKKFVDSDRREYVPGDIMELEGDDNKFHKGNIKIDRLMYYGIIERKPKKKRRRKPKIERAVVL